MQFLISKRNPLSMFSSSYYQEMKCYHLSQKTFRKKNKREYVESCSGNVLENKKTKWQRLIFQKPFEKSCKGLLSSDTAERKPTFFWAGRESLVAIFLCNIPHTKYLSRILPVVNSHQQTQTGGIKQPLPAAADSYRQ